MIALRDFGRRGTQLSDSVVDQPSNAASDEQSVPARRPSIPKWEAAARERLRTAMRRFSKPLSDLLERDANEGDTRLFVTDFLCDALGFDKYSDLTTEYMVRGDYADYGVRIDKELVAFIEVKRVATKLNMRHLRQVEMYAVNEGVEWVVLTNGVVWQVYHLTGGLPVDVQLALEVNVIGVDPLSKRVDQLFYLSRESLKRRQIDDLWRAKRASSPASLVQAICSDPVMQALRRELRRNTGHNIDEGELLELCRRTVIRPECLT